MIHKIHKYADISYFVGNREYWRKGYAIRSVRLVCDYAFNTLNLNRINAGCCILNISSKKVLLNAGFVFEGRRRKERIVDYDSEYHDSECFGLLKEEYVE
jgi:RimJ/RimL family protein N-acetyltransferase